MISWATYPPIDRPASANFSHGAARRADAAISPMLCWLVKSATKNSATSARSDVCGSHNAASHSKPGRRTRGCFMEWCLCPGNLGYQAPRVQLIPHPQRGLGSEVAIGQSNIDEQRQ